MRKFGPDLMSFARIPLRIFVLVTLCTAIISSSSAASVCLSPSSTITWQGSCDSCPPTAPCAPPLNATEVVDCNDLEIVLMTGSYPNMSIALASNGTLSVKGQCQSCPIVAPSSTLSFASANGSVTLSTMTLIVSSITVSVADTFTIESATVTLQGTIFVNATLANSKLEVLSSLITSQLPTSSIFVTNMPNGTYFFQICEVVGGNYLLSLTSSAARLDSYLLFTSELQGLVLGQIPIVNLSVSGLNDVSSPIIKSTSAQTSLQFTLNEGLLSSSASSPPPIWAGLSSSARVALVLTGSDLLNVELPSAIYSQFAANTGFWRDLRFGQAIPSTASIPISLVNITFERTLRDEPLLHLGRFTATTPFTASLLGSSFSTTFPTTSCDVILHSTQLSGAVLSLDRLCLDSNNWIDGPSTPSSPALIVRQEVKLAPGSINGALLRSFTHPLWEFWSINITDVAVRLDTTSSLTYRVTNASNGLNCISVHSSAQFQVYDFPNITILWDDSLVGFAPTIGAQWPLINNWIWENQSGQPYSFGTDGSFAVSRGFVTSTNWNFVINSVSCNPQCVLANANASPACRVRGGCDCLSQFVGTTCACVRPPAGVECVANDWIWQNQTSVVNSNLQFENSTVTGDLVVNGNVSLPFQTFLNISGIFAQNGDFQLETVVTRTIDSNGICSTTPSSKVLATSISFTGSTLLISLNLNLSSPQPCPSGLPLLKQLPISTRLNPVIASSSTITLSGVRLIIDGSSSVSVPSKMQYDLMIARSIVGTPSSVIVVSPPQGWACPQVLVQGGRLVLSIGCTPSTPGTPLAISK